MKIATGIALGWLGLSQPALAGGARFFSEPVLAFGSAMVDARAINDAGAIAGAVTFGQNGGQGGGLTGFVLQGSTESAVNCGSSACYPTSISRDGTVAGFTGTGGFVWKNGAVVASNLPLGTVFGSGPAALPNILLSTRGAVAFTDNTQSGSTSYAGRPGKQSVQKGLSDRFVTINGINARGVLSGWEYATIQGQLTPVIFFGKDGFFDMLFMPGQQQVSGGVINDAGQVAFSRQSGVYIYANGATTAVALPSGAAQPGVQAITNRGRLVGTYVDAGQMQHVFYYNGTSVSIFGAYPVQDTLHVALNDHGVMLVSDRSQTTGDTTSNRVECGGPGC